jgi:predicted DNA-binding transcriptional regulator YafY
MTRGDDHAVRALELRRKPRIVYHSRSAGAPTTRVIPPFNLAGANGTLYVVAFCEKRDALRVFRMDRILEATLSDGEFEVPPDFSLVVHLKDGAPFVTEKPPREMNVRYSPKIARWIAEREELEMAADGSLTVTRPLSDHGWAIRHVLQYGAEAEVIEPESVREEIRTALGRMVKEE